MRQLRSVSPAAGDGFWQWLDDDKERRPTEHTRPPGWYVAAAIMLYGALIVLVGVMLTA